MICLLPVLGMQINDKILSVMKAKSNIECALMNFCQTEVYQNYSIYVLSVIMLHTIIFVGKIFKYYIIMFLTSSFRVVMGSCLDYIVVVESINYYSSRWMYLYCVHHVFAFLSLVCNCWLYCVHCGSGSD